MAIFRRKLQFIFLRLLLWIILVISYVPLGFAQPTDAIPAATKKATVKNKKSYTINNKSPVKEREKKEKQIPPNYFAITLYKPNYLLPIYFTGSPANSVYQNNTPNGESLKHAELKYQLSVKIPVWKNILKKQTSLYFAYTQLSYWQVYNHYSFFRETDYEPEAFLANEINYKISKKWHIDFLNVGAVHQSNGYGNALERSWNRIYLEAILSSDNWMLSIKPWYIMSNGSMHRYNPDIAQFLGYGRLLIAGKYKDHVLSLSAHNFLERHARSITGELTWSFPITSYLKGYVQIFSGYGQSLIEYNHRTNSAGLGIALNDWI